MGEHPIDVSVIVPCYNVESYVDQALSSAEDNDVARIEIIAVNDGSTDGTLEILQTHEAKDPRVRVIEKPNGGYGAAVNRGIDEARGTYIAILESDDYVLPHMYDDLYDLARQMGEPDVVRSSYWRVICADKGKGAVADAGANADAGTGTGADAAGERRIHGYCYRRIHPRTQPFVLGEAPQLIQYHPAVWSGLYRRDFLHAEGIRMKEVPGGGWVDNPFVVDALARAKAIAYTDDAWYCYREDIAGTSTAARTARLAFERWSDRQDILDRLGVRDRGVLRANYVVLFRFAAAALASGELEDPDIRTLAAAQFARLDPAIALGIDECGWAVQALYRETVGATPWRSPAADRLIGKTLYTGHLISEGLWSLGANGVRATFDGMLLARTRARQEGERK